MPEAVSNAAVGGENHAVISACGKARQAFLGDHRDHVKRRLAVVVKSGAVVHGENERVRASRWQA
jgi:hypothetical protein